MDGHTQAPGVPQHQDKSRRDRWRGAAVVIGLVISSAVVWQSTQAAFSATTSNDDNNFGAGTVTLTGADTGGTMFTVPDLAPGDTGTDCVDVTYDGSLDADVKLYLENGVDVEGGTGGAQLDDELDMRIELGAAGSTCAAFVYESDLAGGAPGTKLATMETARTNFSDGYATWSPTGAGPAEPRPFRFTYLLPVTAGNSVQGDTYEVDFQWEAQNT